jgi:methionine synthase II (cobalamin-independent)
MVLMPDALPLLPTTVVGSHGLPRWLWLAREALAANFWETPRGVCRRKLEALVAGARQMRRELGG